MIRKLSSIDEVHEMDPKFDHKTISYTCDMCKMHFDADHVVTKNDFITPIYDDSLLSIMVRKGSRTYLTSMRMCPECTEKLLELLDKHFPRLNLEDEL